MHFWTIWSHWSPYLWQTYIFFAMPLITPEKASHQGHPGQAHQSSHDVPRLPITACLSRQTILFEVYFPIFLFPLLRYVRSQAPYVPQLSMPAYSDLCILPLRLWQSLVPQAAYFAQSQEPALLSFCEWAASYSRLSYQRRLQTHLHQIWLYKNHTLPQAPSTQKLSPQAPCLLRVDRIPYLLILNHQHLSHKDTACYGLTLPLPLPLHWYIYQKHSCCSYRSVNLWKWVISGCYCTQAYS